MGKILLLVLAAWLLLKLLKMYRRSVETPNPPVQTGDMVPCKHCGVHVPLGEAVQENGKHYCSHACQNAGHQAK